MPNSDRSKTYTFNLIVGSQTYNDIEADIASAPIGQPGSVLALRLRDHYDALREGRYLPPGWTLDKILRLLSPSALATLATEAVQPPALPQWRPPEPAAGAGDVTDGSDLVPSVGNATDDDVSQWLS